jgi:hypothetical protein
MPVICLRRVNGRRRGVKWPLNEPSSAITSARMASLPHDFELALPEKIPRGRWRIALLLGIGVLVTRRKVLGLVIGFFGYNYCFYLLL